MLRSGVLCILTEHAITHLPSVCPRCLSLSLLDHLQVEVVLIRQQHVPPRGLGGRLYG